MNYTRSILRGFVLGTFVLALAAYASDIAWAQGKGKGGGGGGGDNGDTTLAGTIYLKAGNTVGSMPADGTSAPEPLTFAGNTQLSWYEPSFFLHGPAIDEQDRWFAGDSNGQIYILDRFGNEYPVAGPQLVPYTDNPRTLIRWISDGQTDIGVSWFGIEYDASGMPAVGLYRADIAWDTSGLPVVAHAIKLFDIPVFVDGSEYRYDAAGHSWNPDGSTVAVSTSLDNAHTNLFTWNNPLDGFQLLAIDAWTPEWSPTTDVPGIVYDSLDGIMTINEDGSNETLLATPGGGKNFKGVLNPHWSPDGQYIIYDFFEFARNGHYYDVFLIPSSGGRKQNLTEEYINMEAVAWR